MGRRPAATVAYKGAHRRIARLWGKARQYSCISCGEQATDWAYDGTDPNQLVGPNGSSYSLDPIFYMPMCRSCHFTMDRRAHARVECARGHALTGENLRITIENGRERRRCIECQRAYLRQWMRDRRALARQGQLKQQ